MLKDNPITVPRSVDDTPAPERSRSAMDPVHLLVSRLAAEAVPPDRLAAKHLTGSAQPPAAASREGLYEAVSREAGSFAQRVSPGLLPAAILALVGALAIRRTLRPIGALADAAVRVGRRDALRVPEAGHGEVRRLIRAFNDMQVRVRQLIADRIDALAAVGHDLRTPLSRLQLRTDAIADPELRRAVEKDVGEMCAMLSPLLAYFAGDSDPEKPVRADVAVMASTMVDDVQDRGLAADFSGMDHVETRVRPLGLKRALANLVENALHYGGVAHVAVTEECGTIILSVEGDGPGIAEDRIGAALQPFLRLDPACGRNASGLGLGLAIVQRAMEREGGTVRLSNRAQGGLRAELRLPRRRSAF